MAEKKPISINYQPPGCRAPWLVMHWGGWAVLIGLVGAWLISWAGV